MSAEPDPWSGLRRFTGARIALGRAGHALPTAETLSFALAHAQARDAVHAVLDVEALQREIVALGVPVLVAGSEAGDRPTYLARPDLGRRLDPASQGALEARRADGIDLAIVLADGLSAPAVARHGAALLAALLPWRAAAGWSLAPLVIATQARVALGDAVATCLGARAVLTLIGERPGLSAPDSLGAYLTVDPRPGATTDAARNCLSNIRPEGLGYEAAAFRIAWLLGEALRRGVTGVGLKDESDRLVLDGMVPRPALPSAASGGKHLTSSS